MINNSIKTFKLRNSKGCVDGVQAPGAKLVVLLERLIKILPISANFMGVKLATRILTSTFKKGFVLYNRWD